MDVPQNTEILPRITKHVVHIYATNVLQNTKFSVPADLGQDLAQGTLRHVTLG